MIIQSGIVNHILHDCQGKQIGWKIFRLIAESGSPQSIEALYNLDVLSTALELQNLPWNDTQVEIHEFLTVWAQCGNAKHVFAIRSIGLLDFVAKKSLVATYSFILNSAFPNVAARSALVSYVRQTLFWLAIGLHSLDLPTLCVSLVGEYYCGVDFERCCVALVSWDILKLVKLKLKGKQ